MGVHTNGRKTVANPSKQKGTEWETRVTKFLQANGFPYAERKALAGQEDQGDIKLDPYGDVILEAKAAKQIQLGPWMNETQAEIENADATYGATVIKRRNHNVERAYVVMELKDWADLVVDAGYGSKRI